MLLGYFFGRLFCLTVKHPNHNCIHAYVCTLYNTNHFEHTYTYRYIVLHCILENEYTNICAHLEHYPRTYHFLFSPPSESLAFSLQTKLTEQKILHNENVKMFIFTRSFRTNSRFRTFQSNFQFIQSNSAHTQHQTNTSL